MKDLNFFEPYQGKKKEKVNTKIYIYGVAVFVGFIIIFTLAFNSIKLFMLGRQINNYAQELEKTEIQEELREAQNVNSQIEVLSKYDNSLMDVAKSVKDRDNVSAVLLSEINATVPSEVAFKNINITNNTIVIQGTASNRTSIAELQHNLKEIPKMSDVYVSSIGSSGAVEGEYSFDVKCVLKDVD